MLLVSILGVRSHRHLQWQVAVGERKAFPSSFMRSGMQVLQPLHYNLCCYYNYDGLKDSLFCILESGYIEGLRVELLDKRSSILFCKH